MTTASSFSLLTCSQPPLIGAYGDRALEIAGVLALQDNHHPDLHQTAIDAAIYRAASWRMATGLATTLELDGAKVELPGSPFHERHPVWEESWGHAWSLRSTALIDALLASRYETTAAEPGVIRGPSTPLWMAVFPELERDGDWLDLAERGAALTSESAVDSDSWPHVKRIHHGLRAIAALARPADFNDELRAFVIAHDDEIMFKGLLNTHSLAIAWLPLGVAAKAQDRGIEVTVESDYLPPVLLHPT